MKENEISESAKALHQRYQQIELLRLEIADLIEKEMKDLDAEEKELNSQMNRIQVKKMEIHKRRNDLIRQKYDNKFYTISCVGKKTKVSHYDVGLFTTRKIAESFVPISNSSNGIDFDYIVIEVVKPEYVDYTTLDKRPVNFPLSLN